MVNLKINGIPVTVEDGTTILNAALKANIKIPTLCYLKGVNEIGACRVCVVEVKNARTLIPSCVIPVSEGMEVFTNTERVRKARKKTLELTLSDHNKDCLSCCRNLKCELQALSEEYGCNSQAYNGEVNEFRKDTSSVYLERDYSKCIVCKRCVAACKKQHVAIIGANNRGFHTHIGCALDDPLDNSPCIACGQCVNVCPTGALKEKEEIVNVQKAIADPDKFVVVASAPAVRAALGEEFGLPIGTNVEGKMATALKMLGFNKVFDVNFAADLTIMEEANELVHRVQNKLPLPMITSCSPGWIRYMEFMYPEIIPHISTCKSPQQMYGAVTKTYYAEKNNIDPKNIYTVSIMPCTAKKFEKTREGQSASGYPDIDAVLTTRELGKMIRQAGIMFKDLPDGTFDHPLGNYSGAGVIFGASGGVMEAALRTAAETILGKPVKNLDYKEVRGTLGTKEAEYNLDGLKIKVCVTSGISNAKEICEKVKSGKADYHFIEIMSCEGGCINGGGQPIVDAFTRGNCDVKALRAKALYDIDGMAKIRKSHENPVMKELYDNFFEKPGSHKAHKVLHTSYKKREKYKI